MQDNPIVLGFAAGELSPWLSTRVDLAQYGRGAAHLENFLVEPYGGVRRRNGTKHLCAAGANADAIRLFPFSYSATENVMLEFYPSTLRFYVGGELVTNADGSVYTVATPWDTADKVNHLRMVQVNDVIFVTCPYTSPYKISRYGRTDWRCKIMSFSPYPRKSYLPQEAELTIQRSSLHSDVVDISTSSDADSFTADMVDKEYLIADCPLSERSYWKDATMRICSMGTIDDLNQSIDRGDRFSYNPEGDKLYKVYTCIKNWTPDCAYQAASDSPEDYPDYFFAGVACLSDGYPYYVSGDWELRTMGEWDGSWELRLSYDDMSVSNSYYDWKWVTLHQFYQNEDEPRENWAFSGSETTPCYMMIVCNEVPTKTVQWLEPVVASGTIDSPLKFEIKQCTRELTIQITAVTDANHATGRILTPLFNLPYSFKTRKWSFGAMGELNGYPQFVGVNQGRLWLGGMAGQPTTLMASTVDDYGNFRMTSDADSALQLTLASDDQSRICWLSTTKGLLLGTSEGEWVLESSNGEGLSATNASFARQSSVGSENKESYSVENSIFYVQRGGKRLREISYKLESDGYTSTDTSLLAEHLFESGVKEWAVQRGGSAHVWVLMNDGSVAVLTTNIVQQVTAWQRMSFGGDEVLHVTTLPNANSLDDEVWLVVRRAQGVCIEQICDDGIYLDRHVTLPVTNGAVSAPHLAGETVLCYADGCEHSAQSVSLPADGLLADSSWSQGSQIHVGVQLESILTTMPLETMSSFNDVSQLGRAKLRLLNADPHFYYKAVHADSWEYYDASVDLREFPFTGAIRVSQIPKPGVGQGFSIRYTGLRSFNLLALDIERDFHGK
ncbi:MAG: hypothetical protein R3Y56_07590 [Akkermansia sp.]